MVALTITLISDVVCAGVPIGLGVGLIPII